MRVLIVFAHPEPRSFNGALKDLAVETLTEAGHEVRLSDLYAAKFGAVTGADDFLCQRTDPDFLSIQASSIVYFWTHGDEHTTIAHHGRSRVRVRFQDDMVNHFLRDKRCGEGCLDHCCIL